MDSQRKLITGFDLCEDFSQISCYSYKTFEPIPIGYGEKEEDCMLPTALCVTNDTKQWLYGKDALRCASEKEGVLVKNFLQKIKDNEITEIFGEKYTGVELLERYFKKTLSLLKKDFPTELITKLVVTVKETDPIIADGIYEALHLLGLDKDRAFVMNHSCAYLYYALSQDRALWANDVGLFDYDEDGLIFYRININRRQQPMVAKVIKTDLRKDLSYDMLKQKDINLRYTFENLADRTLYKQIISTLYFTGKGFDGKWAEEAFVKLCAGRRAFFGQNLYPKGACYAAKELSGDVKLTNMLLLNDDMIPYSISIWVYVDAKLKEIPITDALVPWYEVKNRIEVIPENETELELIFKNIMTREYGKEKLDLSPLPQRPDRMTRLEISLSCPNRTTAKITVTDLGFGAIYPGTGILKEFTINMNEE